MARGRRPNNASDVVFNRGEIVPGGFNPPVGVPPCPKFLHDYAKEEWKRIVTQLESTGALSTVDLAVMSLYCQTFARWRQAEEVVQELGIMQAWKIAKLAEGYAKQLKSIVTELGFTPAARSKVKPPAKPEGDELDEFLGGSK